MTRIVLYGNQSVTFILAQYEISLRVSIFLCVFSSLACEIFPGKELNLQVNLKSANYVCYILKVGYSYHLNLKECLIDLILQPFFFNKIHNFI
jgi:hypothetical protein